MIDLFEAAQQFQSFCEKQRWQFCFIGGVAVQRWGQVRLTRDIDLTLFTGFGREETYIQTLLGSYEPRRQDAAEFARRNRVLLLTAPEGTGIDVSLGALPFEQSAVERATYFNFGGEVALRTCSAEDLIVLKLFASRAIDVRDAESVAIRHKKTLDWKYIDEQLRPLVELKEEPEILDTLARLRRL